MKPKRTLDKIYSRIAGIYDHVYGPFLEKGRDTLFADLPQTKNPFILEVGIGTGLSLGHYSKDAEVVGIDISKEMLHEAQKKAKRLHMMHVKLVHMSAEQLNFPDDTFDFVACPSVLSVVPSPHKVMDEMIRVCKTGGHIGLVSHFTGESSLTRLIDKVCDPVTSRFIGFHMNTPRELVENNKHIRIIKKQPIWFLNFSHCYLLQKK